MFWNKHVSDTKLKYKIGKRNNVEAKILRNQNRLSELENQIKIL